MTSMVIITNIIILAGDIFVVPPQAHTFTYVIIASVIMIHINGNIDVIVIGGW